MDKKTIFIISSIIAILVIIVIIFIVLSSNPSTSPSTASGSSILETCNTLKYNSESAVNLVFFSPKEQTEKYSDFLLKTSPFDKNQEKFNIYYISDSDFKPECELYKGIAILCYSKSLIKVASSCPNDYIVVLENRPGNIRSSSYMNVLSINTALPLNVLTHEFGHAFANFAEEYTPADIPRGSKNCQSSCDKFNVKDSCNQGCSKTDYFRSIESGVMRTLSSNEYGIFNQQIILDKLNKDMKKETKTTGKVVASLITCQNQNYYLIEGLYNQAENSINVIDKSIETGCISAGGSGSFTYNIILNDNSIITGSEFNPELIFTDGQLEEETIINGETFQSDKPFLLKVPIISNAKNLEINKDAERITEISLNDIEARPCLI